jgi:hypothetical protein
MTTPGASIRVGLRPWERRLRVKALDQSEGARSGSFYNLSSRWARARGAYGSSPNLDSRPIPNYRGQLQINSGRAFMPAPPDPRASLPLFSFFQITSIRAILFYEEG